ncbi:MAG: FtsX-like permease family protein [bacterium]|nr:FtsX-like permease family protein [bacterium]
MFRNYLKTAFKVFLRRKFFTFVSLFGISLTLLVLLVATAFLDHLFGPQPPEVRLGRTLGIFQFEIKGGPRVYQFASPGYQFLTRYVLNMTELPEVENVSVFSRTPVEAVSYPQGEKLVLRLRRTDGAYWQILDFDFLEGGPFTADDEAHSRPVAVISVATRRRCFGDQEVVGRTLVVDGQRFRVAGVVADVSSVRPVSLSAGEVWVPISTAKSPSYRHQFTGEFCAMILARSRADFPAIRSEYRRRVAEVEFPQPEHDLELISSAETLFETMTREYFGLRTARARWNFRALIVLLMLLFMVLPAVNLVNLNVSRILERASEIGIRKAFGASRRVLVGQFVVENVLLTLLGGAVGLGLAALVLGLMSDNTFLPYAVFEINFRVFAWGLLITLVFGLVSGIYPAWRMSRLHPARALQGRLS